MKNTEIFAAYLPQYHETEDNNKFWGKGYTDWCAVKSAKPLFEGHEQPKIPENDKYYDLSDYKNIIWQAKLAKANGIDGFNIYHYWFKDGRHTLEKPAELLLAHPEIDIEYFFTWDNGSWKRTWSNVPGNEWAPSFENDAKQENDNGILIEFAFQGKEQWKQHFEYLTPFFKDKRYKKIDNKPVFMFFSRERKEIIDMQEYWDELAREIGFDGVYICCQKKKFVKKVRTNANFLYQPAYSVWSVKNIIVNRLPKVFKLRYNRKLKIYDYEKSWGKVLSDTKKIIDDKIVPGAFISYDDTPRRGAHGKVINSQTLLIFKDSFSELYKMCCKHDCELLLITAWNEWGEGAYLEPDNKDRIDYLKAIRMIKNEAN